MKKNQIKALSICSLIAVSLTLLSAGANDDTITKENDMFVVNTTTIGKNIEGYNGPTPLKIYIKKNKVVKIEALKNAETPKYYAKVKKALLEKWDFIVPSTKTNSIKKALRILSVRPWYTLCINTLKQRGYVRLKSRICLMKRTKLVYIVNLE